MINMTSLNVSTQLKAMISIPAELHSKLINPHPMIYLDLYIMLF